MKKNILFIIIAMMAIACEKNNENEFEPALTEVSVVLDEYSYYEISQFTQMKFINSFHGDRINISDMEYKETIEISLEMITTDVTINCHGWEKEKFNFKIPVSPGWYYMSFDFYDKDGIHQNIPIVNCVESDTIFIDEGLNYCYIY